MRGYLIAGALGAFIVAIAAAYFIGRNHERAEIMAKLKDERIEILVDGKKVDDEVLAADDDALCDMLGGCGVLD